MKNISWRKYKLKDAIRSFYPYAPTLIIGLDQWRLFNFYQGEFSCYNSDKKPKFI